MLVQTHTVLFRIKSSLPHTKVGLPIMRVDLRRSQLPNLEGAMTKKQRRSVPLKHVNAPRTARPLLLPSVFRGSLEAAISVLDTGHRQFLTAVRSTFPSMLAREQEKQMLCFSLMVPRSWWINCLCRLARTLHVSVLFLLSNKFILHR